MIPVLIGIGLVTSLGALALLSSEENEVRSDYEHNRHQLANETKQRTSNIQKLQREIKQAEDFYKHLALYRASIQSSKVTFDLYDSHKKIMDAIYYKIQYFRNKITELQLLHSQNTGEKRQQYHQELSSMHLHLSQANKEFAILKIKKEVLLNNLTEINHQTHVLKMYIAKYCGQQGQEWYSKLES